MPDTSFNLLPEDEQKKIQEALPKGPEQKAEVKLVMPKVEGRTEEIVDPTKKMSWWQKRQFKKQQREEEERRKRGEIGVLGSKKVQTTRSVQAPKAVAPELFSDVVTPEKDQSWWESQPKPAKKPEPKPVPAPPKPVSPEPPKPKPKPEPVPKKVEKPKIEEKPKPEPKKIAEPKKDVKKPSLKRKVKPLVEEKDEPEKDPEIAEPSVNLVSEYKLADAGQYGILLASLLIGVSALWFLAFAFTLSRVKRAESIVSQQQSQVSRIDGLMTEITNRTVVAKGLQVQFAAVKELIEGHVYWTPVLSKLEELTIPDVYYTNVTVSDEGVISLQAIGKNYAAAARQIRAFEQAPSFAQSVEVNKAELTEQPEAELPVPVVSFDINLQIDTELLFIPEEDILVTPSDEPASSEVE